MNLLPFTFISFTFLLPLSVLFSFPANLHESDRDLSPAIKLQNLGEWPLGLSPMARSPSFPACAWLLPFFLRSLSSPSSSPEMRAKGASTPSLNSVWTVSAKRHKSDALWHFSKVINSLRASGLIARGGIFPTSSFYREFCSLRLGFGANSQMTRSI